MTIMEGARLKHKFTKQFYTVRIIKNGTFILASEDTPYRIWIGDRDVDLFFEMVEKGKIDSIKLSRQ
jgi:hypothetical protein